MADEAFDTRELGRALDDSAAPAAPPSTSTPQRPPPPIDVLSNDVLVSIFAAISDSNFVRRTIPLVCKDWAELYRSKDASPLHETLRVDFEKEVDKAVEAAQKRVGGGGRPVAGKPATAAQASRRGPFSRPLVHASRVISWAERRAGSVHKLFICGVEDGATKDFSFKEMGKLVTATGPSLTDLCFDFNFYLRSQVRGELRRRRGGFYVLPDLKPIWKAVRDSVAPAGRLRVLEVLGADFSEKDLEPLKQLAGSLEFLLLRVFDVGDPGLPRPGEPGIPRRGIGLPRFPELLCDLTELKLLALGHHLKIEAIPAKISSLKKLKHLDLEGCRLSSLPKELGKLSRLIELHLKGNENLGTALPAAEAFPAALGKMKSLRFFNLQNCGLRAVPAFVGELASLDDLDLSGNENLGNAPQHEAFPAALGKMKSLRDLVLQGCGLRAVPAFVGELASLESMDISENLGLGDAPEDIAFPAALGKMKSLKNLGLARCGLRAVPAFLGELTSLQILILNDNENLGDAPQHSAFPAALGRMKSLRQLYLPRCGLRAVPAFVSELESLEILYLAGNEKLGGAPQDEAFPAELGKMKSLRELDLSRCGLRADPAFVGELESLEVLNVSENEVDAAALDALRERCRRLREVIS